MSIESNLLARVNELHDRIDSLAYRDKTGRADDADIMRDDVHDELFMPMEDVREYAAAVVQHIAAQDAEIARLRELVMAVKSNDYEISCADVSAGNWFDARAALKEQAP